MLILLYGEDTFRARQKLNEIIKEYQAKHQSGLNLVRFDKDNLDLDKIREAIEAVSMFSEKKLIILENCLNDKNFQEEFLQYLKKNKLKNNQEVIAVIYQEGKFAVGLLKSKLNMLEEFKFLQGQNLISWIKGQISQNQGKISSGAVNQLAVYVGNDLWQMSNEINKLTSYRAGQAIEPTDVDLMVKAKIDLNVFKLLDALAQRDKKTALKLLHQHLSEGESELRLLAMVIYQVRTLLRLKDLIERGNAFGDLAKKTGLHPYVIKKSWAQLNNFSLEQLKKIFQRLLSIDLALKNGRLDGPTALDLLVAEM